MQISRLLILAVSFLFFFAALLYWPDLIRLFHPVPTATAKQMHLIQITFLLAAAAFYWFSRMMVRSSMLRTFFQKPLPPKLLLSFVVVLVPLLIAELSLRPFTDFQFKWTTIFIPDERLGWKFKPNTHDRWGNIVMDINRKGLRGPELPYQKPKGTLRILFLGDSVTAGYQIAEIEQTFAHLTQERIQQAIHTKVEAINAAVDGYSPWQEMFYLQDEGIRYDPDLIVIGFVLNDVIERFTLTRFGGISKGTQLSWTISPATKWVVEHSSLVFTTYKRIIYGIHQKENKKLEKQVKILSTSNLILQPDRSEIRYAWETTLMDLQKIFDFCAARRIPVVLVAFPYDFQFENVAANSIPQRILSEFATTKQVPFLDLLPLLANEMETKALTTSDLFLDDDGHLSPLGNRIVAELLASFILQERVLKPAS